MSTEDKNWKTMEGYTDADLSGLISLSEISKIQSHSPLLKIKRNLRIDIFSSILGCGLFVLLIFLFDYWLIRLAMAILLAYTIWELYTAFVQYRNIKADVLENTSVLAELKRQQSSIAEWLRLQRRVSLFITPFSAACGIMLGRASSPGRSVEEMISNPSSAVIFIVMVIVIAPISYLVSKLFYQLRFGNHLADLQKTIGELEGDI